MTKEQQYMHVTEIAESALRGNRIARKINPNPMPRAAIRHALAKQGRHDAVRLASELMNISLADAHRVIETLQATKPDDIVSPHYE